PRYPVEESPRSHEAPAYVDQYLTLFRYPHAGHSPPPLRSHARRLAHKRHRAPAAPRVISNRWLAGFGKGTRLNHTSYAKYSANPERRKRKFGARGRLGGTPSRQSARYRLRQFLHRMDPSHIRSDDRNGAQLSPSDRNPGADWNATHGVRLSPR